MYWTDFIRRICIRGYKSGSSISVCFRLYIRVQHSFFYHGFLYGKHEVDDKVLSADDENWRGANGLDGCSSLYRQNDTDYDMDHRTIWRVLMKSHKSNQFIVTHWATMPIVTLNEFIWRSIFMRLVVLKRSFAGFRRYSLTGYVVASVGDTTAVERIAGSDEVRGLIPLGSIRGFCQIPVFSSSNDSHRPCTKYSAAFGR